MGGDWSGEERNGLDRKGVDWFFLITSSRFKGEERIGAERMGPEGNGLEGSGAEWKGKDWKGTEWRGREWSGRDRSGVDWFFLITSSRFNRTRPAATKLQVPSFGCCRPVFFPFILHHSSFIIQHSFPTFPHWQD